MVVLLPFIIAVFWIGLYPKPYLNKMDTTVSHYIEQHQPLVLKEKLVDKPSIQETELNTKLDEKEVIKNEH